jgi:hypothetical protein
MQDSTSIRMNRKAAAAKPLQESLYAYFFGYWAEHIVTGQYGEQHDAPNRIDGMNVA